MYREEKIIPPKKVVTVHDISCCGRCAQTVIIPLLSALSVQAVPLPTALLSTHTGGFDDFTFLDLTEQMKDIEKHWSALDISFDGVYTGFLGSEKQIENVAMFAQRCRKRNPGCIFLADPVMGDDGEKYKTYTDSMCLLTRRLIKDADIITPNFTEACILTDTPYRKNPDDEEIRRVFERLSRLTGADIVITGVRIEHPDASDKLKICTVYRQKKGRYSGGFGKAYFGYTDANYPGTGDVFSSVLLSLILQGTEFRLAVERAGAFVSQVADYTYRCETPIREGLLIEPLLKSLIS